MAFGLPVSAGAGGGNFLPIIKYDARAGRIFRIDRVDGVNVPHDITRNFKAVIDFENIEVGFISFNAGGPPDFQLVSLGTPLPTPRTPNHKAGVRVVVKLGAESGGDIRELAGNAGAFMRRFEMLHDAYLAGVKSNPGKLPVVVLQDTIPITSGSGEKKSTNYEPVFEIAGWVARPQDLIAQPRGDAPIAPKATPPETGSTKVAAPKKAPVEEFAEDFG